MSRLGPSRRVRRGVGRGRREAAHQPVEIVAVLPAECGHGGRGGCGEAVFGAVWREAVELEDLRDQEQHALRRSELFLDRDVGDRRGRRHVAAHSAIGGAGSEVRHEEGRRKGDEWRLVTPGEGVDRQVEPIVR